MDCIFKLIVQIHNVDIHNRQLMNTYINNMKNRIEDTKIDSNSECIYYIIQH